MNKKRNGRVTGAWDVGFHDIVERARKEYSRQLGKEIHTIDVTRLWADPRVTRFRYPKLRKKI